MMILLTVRAYHRCVRNIALHKGKSKRQFTTRESSASSLQVKDIPILDELNNLRTVATSQKMALVFSILYTLKNLSDRLKFRSMRFYSWSINSHLRYDPMGFQV